MLDPMLWSFSSTSGGFLRTRGVWTHPLLLSHTCSHLHRLLGEEKTRCLVRPAPSLSWLAAQPRESRCAHAGVCTCFLSALLGLFLRPRLSRLGESQLHVEEAQHPAYVNHSSESKVRLLLAEHCAVSLTMWGHVCRVLRSWGCAGGVSWEEPLVDMSAWWLWPSVYGPADLATV